MMFSVAQSAQLSASYSIKGHGYDTFSSVDHFLNITAGGAAWSQDSRVVYTLDTTGQLMQWEAQTGRLLSQRIQKSTVSQEHQILFLDDVGGDTLKMRTAFNTKYGRKERAFKTNIKTNGIQSSQACLPTKKAPKICSGKYKAWIEKGQLWKKYQGQTTQMTLSKGLKFGPLAWNKDHSALAVLAFQPKEKNDSSGPLSLLIWNQQGPQIS